jgi:hypothetical protein
MRLYCGRVMGGDTSRSARSIKSASPRGQRGIAGPAVVVRNSGQRSTPSHKGRFGRISFAPFLLLYREPWSKSLKLGVFLSPSVDAVDAKFCICNLRAISQAGRRRFALRWSSHSNAKDREVFETSCASRTQTNFCGRKALGQATVGQLVRDASGLGSDPGAWTAKTMTQYRAWVARSAIGG